MLSSTLRRRLLALTAGASLSLPALGAVEEGQLPLQELRTFAEVFNQIRVGYVEDIDDSTLLEFAIQGMLMGLDPHSVYLTEEAFEGLQESTTGEFNGLGLEVGMQDGYVTVIAPIDGSPAEKAGLRSGDVILKLGTTPVKGMSLGEAIGLMRGPAGSEIQLTIGRPGESQPFDVTLVRDVIKVASVRKRWLEPGFAYVRIAQFQADTGKDVAKAVSKLAEKDEIKGLVLDLRNNPGGVLRASVDVAGLFMDGGLVVYTEGRVPNAHASFEAEPVDALDGKPVVVLINAGSASASEIVAGALQDHRRAVIMGTRSFGKGSVQTVLPISDSRAVKLTTALYFTPNGRSIQAEGIVPDIEVQRATETTFENEGGITEADLSRHLNNVNGDSKTKSNGDTRKLQSDDNQLYEALSLLKGLNVLGMREKPKAPATPAPKAES
ncbi:S41 family peptidase [Mangrovimicrobium sediminis]|uniref:S41 family peptidase n=1 Tax=Mangrovimicrobium sediminis TaxID=2562682 RepID=A0A4Z0LZH0_9GAMM|nr:S41 family peptidase [Haliea sp. SAOS-164]TGD72624.1 S41 family peptidase [Haliea sp. SAOS-164]